VLSSFGFPTNILYTFIVFAMLLHDPPIFSSLITLQNTNYKPALGRCAIMIHLQLTN